MILQITVRLKPDTTYPDATYEEVDVAAGEEAGIAVGVFEVGIPAAA